MFDSNMGREAIRAEALVKHVRDRNCHKLIQISIAPIGQGAKEMRAIKRKGHRVGSCMLSPLPARQLTEQKAQTYLSVIHRKNILNRTFSQLLREFQHIRVDLAERCHLLVQAGNLCPLPLVQLWLCAPPSKLLV